MKPKAWECGYCHWFTFVGIVPACSKGHKMRFYQPRNPLDHTFGWRRRCDDFVAKPAPELIQSWIDNGDEQEQAETWEAIKHYPRRVNLDNGENISTGGDAGENLGVDVER
jgi:hypothetical protein